MQFTYIPRHYIHFDLPVDRERAEMLATTPERVARHPFYPFLVYTNETEKIYKADDGKVHRKPVKRREIAYAAHRDAHIFSHYAAGLEALYEAELRVRSLDHCVIAFRRLNGRCNIHFADEVFEFIARQEQCAVLAADISDFFGTIDHRLLKRGWARTLKAEQLPSDHYAVFKAITAYAKVDRVEVCKALGIDPDNLKADDRRRLCKPKEFRQIIRGCGLCQTNRSGHGIPQGSPISAVLANLYMLDFDTELSAIAAAHGCMYRRYCDDILIVLPTPALRAAAAEKMRSLTATLRLTIHPEKTEAIDFQRKDNRVTATRTLRYLGFEFDGLHKRIRSASIARYYKKMRAGVGRAKAIRWKSDQQLGKRTPLRRRKLYVLYSYVGRHNFLSYAFKAARIMNDPGIKRQVKRHWARLKSAMDDTH